MVEAAKQLVDGLGPESVAHLGPVEGHTDGAMSLGSVVRNVVQFGKTGDIVPL